MWKFGLLISVLVLELVGLSPGRADTCRADAGRPEDHFPNYSPALRYEAEVAKGQRDYVKFNFDYRAYLNFHTWNGIYFRYNTARSYEGNPDKVSFDSEGLPLINYPPLPDLRYAGGYEYNPTTLIQFALMEHAKYLSGDKSRITSFLKAVNAALRMQNEEGGFEYPFPFKHSQNGTPYEPGWISAISQGQALSMLARAYALTNDRKYISAGNAALNVLLKPTEAGGLRSSLINLDPSLSGYITFEEYPVQPPAMANYTINGFMHTLVGLYDWSFVKDAAEYAGVAQQYYSCGLATLKKIIPYADVGGFSAYDLTHVISDRKPIIAPSYHEAHIYLLLTFYQMSHDEFFLDWASKWQRDVEPSFVQKQFIRWSVAIYVLFGAIAASGAGGYCFGRFFKATWARSRPGPTSS